ncbi:MAG: hypothetical protein ACYDH2_13225 [Anaerolineaceae bacterium]
MANKLDPKQPKLPRVYSWLQLSEVPDKVSRGSREPSITSLRGRPRSNFPQKQHSIYLTAADMESIEKVRKIVNSLSPRTVPKGEIFGMLANIILTRINDMGLVATNFIDLTDFVDRVIGDESTNDK